jgi:RNA polymerase sigma factor (sigma-70 family)
MRDSRAAVDSDEALVRRTRHGDASAFAELWERHYRAGLMAARSFSSIDADDLVSEAFTRIFKRTVDGGGPRGAFRPYLYTTIRNLACTWGTENARHVTIDEIEDFEPGESAEEPVTRLVDRDLTVRAYESLPDRWRTVLWYTEVEGLDPHDVAPILGMTANGVAALSYRAREGLRKAWLQAHVTGRGASPECEWSIARLGERSRHAVTARESRRLEGHLAACAACARMSVEVDEVGSRLAMAILPLVGGGLLVGGALGASAGVGAGAGGGAAAAAASVPAVPAAIGAAGAGAASTGVSAGMAAVAASAALVGAIGVGAVATAASEEAPAAAISQLQSEGTATTTVGPGDAVLGAESSAGPVSEPLDPTALPTLPSAEPTADADSTDGTDADGTDAADSTDADDTDDAGDTGDDSARDSTAGDASKESSSSSSESHKKSDETASTGKGLESTVTSTTDTLDATVDATGELVDDTVGSVTDVVDEVVDTVAPGGIVGEVADDVTGTVGSVTDVATDAVSGTVGTATDLVGGLLGGH